MPKLFTVKWSYRSLCDGRLIVLSGPAPEDGTRLPAPAELVEIRGPRRSTTRAHVVSVERRPVPGQPPTLFLSFSCQEVEDGKWENGWEVWSVSE